MHDRVQEETAEEKPKEHKGAHAAYDFMNEQPTELMEGAK